MKKRLLSMILALSMMLTILPVNAITALAADDKSGACGDGLTYTMIQNDDGTDTYTLAITGTGAMTDYGYHSAPWDADCGKITKLTIDGATSIGESAFEGCRNLTDVVILSGVTSIGEDAFEFCEKLTNTSISSILKEATSIGDHAFYGCTSLTSVEIPESVTSIDVAAFGGCSNLTSVKILGTITSIAKSTFVSCGKLSDFAIPVSVTSIGDWAFQGCSEFADIKIPEKVTSIGNHAFENCTSLTTIKIPDSVTSIGESAFNGCSSLHHVDLPYVIPTISQGAFNNVNTHYYYPGYRSDFVSQAQKIATGIIGMESPTYSLVHCYSDIIFNANGGSFADGGTQKKVEKVWSATQLTQEQVDSIGMPKQAGKIFLGWNTTSNATTTINPTSDYVVDGKIYYAVYRDVVPATIAINGSNKTFKAGTESDTFTVTATKGDTEAAKVKFKFTNGTVQYKNNSTDWTDLTGNEISIDELNSALFRIATNKNATVGTSTLTVELVTDQGTEIGVQNTADFTVTARTPTNITITAPTNNAVKAGEPSQTFTMSITNNDDAVGKVTFDFDGEVQYADNTYSPNWTTVDKTAGVTRAIATGKYFRVVPKADAATGDMTLTAKLVDTDGNEITGATASTTFAVTARKPAEVTITGLDNTTVKAGEVQDFTVSVTPNDDTINKVTFVTTSGEVQWSSDNGNTWTTVSGDVDYSALTGKKFRVVPAADAANGTVTVTVTAKKADGTEIAKTASFTVTAREHATVKINELNGKTIKQNKAYTFTVTVTAHDDSGKTTLKFDNVAGLTHNGTAVTDAGVTVALTNQPAPLTFTLTPDAEGAGKTLTATLNNGATDTATYTVSEYEHAKVTIDGLGTDLKQGESKDFTVKVDPKDDSGDATIDFGDKNSEIQYKDGEDWKSMPSGGLEIDLSNGEKTYDFRITPKNDGSQTLTATVKQNDNELDRVEQTYTVAKKDEPTTPGGGENPGGGSTGGSENPGGGNTGDGDNTGDKDPETKSYELTVIGGSFTAKQGENALDVETTKENNTLTAKIPAGAVVTVTLNKAAVPEGMNFDQWNINDDTLMGNPKVAYDQESFHFTMPDHDVKVEVMYKDATIESDGPGILGTGALIATGVVGSAALLYQGHMLGTELYLRYLLPHGAVIPQNRAELAVLLWQDAENPEPVSTTLYSDISDEDSAIQQAARWAVENDLMEQLDADEHPDHFDPFVPVTFSDSIRAWKKAQELKKSVH